MGGGLTLDILLSIAAGGILLALAAYVAIARRHRATWKAGFVLLLAGADLTIAHGLQGYSTEFATKLFWYKMFVASFALATTSFVFLAIRYGRGQKPLPLSAWFLLCLFPAITTALIFTNEYHGWIWVPERTESIVHSMRFLTGADAGVWYWIYVAYSYLIALLGCGLLIRLQLGSRGFYERQVLGICAGVFVAATCMATDVFGLSPFAPFVASGLGFGIAIVSLVFALSVLRRLDLLVISRKALVDRIPDGILVVDATDRVVDMNPAALRLLGVTEPQAGGYPLSQFLPAPAVASNPSSEATTEVTYADVIDGEERTFDVSVSALNDPRGNRAGRVIALRDITARKDVERRIRVINEELEERVAERTKTLQLANKDLEAFATSISHDLRGPLRVIAGYTEILVDEYGGALGSTGNHLCGVVQTEAHRLAQLLDDLLTFSRFGRASVQKAPVDMTALAFSAFEEATSAEDRRRVEFQVDQLPSAVGDSILLRHVWLNLVSNAIKFTSKREQPEIHVTGNESETETVYSIADNGTGFDPTHAKALFGVFQRLHDVGEFPGRGVGLAIVRRIIDGHGGRVWAEGVANKGATFHFALPRTSN